MGNNISGEDYDKEVFQSYRIPPKAYKKKISPNNKSGSDSSGPASPSSAEFNAPPILRKGEGGVQQPQNQYQHQSSLPFQQRYRTGSLSSHDRSRRGRPISHPVSVLSNASSSSSLNLSIVNAALASGSPSPSLYAYPTGPVSAPLPAVYNEIDHNMGTTGSRTNSGFSIGSESFDLGSGQGKASYVDGKVVEMGPMSANSQPFFLHNNHTVQDFISYQQYQKQQFLEHQQQEYKQMVILQQKQQHLRQQYQQQQQLLLQQQQHLKHQLYQQQQFSEFGSPGQQITGIALQTKTPNRHSDRQSSTNSSQYHSQSITIPSSASATSLHQQAQSSSFSSSTAARQNIPRSSAQLNNYASSPPHAGAPSSFSSTGSQHQTMLAMTNAVSLSSSSPSLSTSGGEHRSSSQQLNSTQAATTSKSTSSSKGNKEGLSLDLSAKILPPRRMLGGREYYPDKTLPYLLPCDEQESERLLLQHYVIRYAFGSNTIPPIDTTLPAKVLDCGCGPGTWVMEMATEYPELEFYGFDISPMYPSAIHPRNAHFSMGNILDPEIPFMSDTYLLVHQRNMLLGLTQDAWPGVVQDLYRCVIPQGWLQLSEVDPIWARPGPASRSFLKMLNETAQSRNVDILLPQRLDQALKDVGCENVKMIVVEIPIGPWGGKIGILWRDVLIAEMEALKPVVLQAELENAIANGQDIAVCGAEMTTSEEWDEMMGQVWAEMDQYHTFSRVYLAYGQRP